MSRYKEHSANPARYGMRLTRTQRALIVTVVTGAVTIAGIGFVGSYGAVRDLAARKGFGDFAVVFPVGIDAGICVLLALDLLLTWLRIPFPLLRQTAWVLTVATIAFNGAAAWPDPLGVGMHAVIPLLFVVVVEAVRHAVGRIADITADRYMEGVRWTRWLLSPFPTFRLWRRMILWEIRRYDDMITAEQDRLVYQAKLRTRYGRAWRWKAPVEQLLPLRIARYGVPLPTGDSAGETSGFPDGSPPGLAARPRNRGTDARGEELPPAQPATSAPTSRAHEPTENNSGDHTGSATDHRGPTASPAPSPQDERGRSSTGKPSTSPAGPDEEQYEPTPGSDRDEEPQDLTDQQHQALLENLTSNADAVRYAVTALDSTHTPTIVEWLKARGRPVNRGQAHRITEAEASKRRKSHMRMIKTGTPRHGPPADHDEPAPGASEPSYGTGRLAE